jgi:hypothetical protein
MFLAGWSAFGAGDRLPCDEVSISPDAKWKTVCMSLNTNNPDSGQKLFLVSHDGTMRELRHVERSCDVLWSADSSHIAVTDWIGSDVSDIFVYTVTNLPSCISLTGLFPQNVLPQNEANGHCYYEAMRWLDVHRLQIHIFGHTDEEAGHEFDHAYIFDISSQQFEKVTTNAPNKALQATRDGRSSSASRFTLVGPACLSFCR